MATERLPPLRLGVNKFLLCSIGQWPYQSIVPKSFFYVLMISLTFTQSYFQIGGMILARSDVDLFLQCFPNVLTDFIIGAKIVNFFFNGNKMKKLLMLMEEDWKKFQKDTELHEILEKSSLYGRKLTLLYTGVFWGSMVPFLLIPLCPVVYNAFASENNTLPRQLLFEQYKYLFDMNKYYYPVFLHAYLGTGAFIMAVVAIDSMFIVYVHHACTLFTIIGDVLGKITRGIDFQTEVYLSESDDKSYRAAVECITTHQHALRYAALIEEAHCVSYFFQLGINMVCISFTGFQIVMLYDTAPETAIRFAGFTITQMTFLFLQSWPAQTLFDNSTEISNFMMDSQWYKASIRTRKLLCVMTMRSQVPCILTAGKFYVLNLASFSAVVRTSMSYIMVLLSMK